LRVRSDTLAPSVNVRDTADWETPASFATSVEEGYLVAFPSACCRILLFPIERFH
jgi:hypothetical protein